MPPPPTRYDGHRWESFARAEFLRRLGRTDEARDALRAALALVSDAAERDLLRCRLNELG